jgi:hypothetical protein
MIDNADDFSDFVGNLSMWEEYITNMKAPCTWGDQVTPKAVCDPFGVVVVHLITTEREHWHAFYQPRERRPPFRHAFLAYISPVHYNALRSST